MFSLRSTSVLAIYAFATVLLAFSAQTAFASRVTYQVKAHVTGVDDPYGLLDGSIRRDAEVTGYYTFDSDIKSSSTDARVGEYWCQTAGAGIGLRAGNYIFESDDKNPNFNISIVNDFNGDSYSVHSYRVKPLGTDVSVDSISFSLTDPTGKAFDTSALSSTPPDLTKFQQDDGPAIRGRKGIKRGEDAKEYLIGLVIDEITVSVDPDHWKVFGAPQPTIIVEPRTVLGDVNQDGKLTVGDVSLLLQSVIGRITLNATQTASADLNGDKRVNIQDANALLRRVSGL